MDNDEIIHLGSGKQAAAYFSILWDRWEAKWNTDFDESNVCSPPESLVDLNILSDSD